MRTRFITVGTKEAADKLRAMRFEYLYQARTDGSYVFINKPEPTEAELEELRGIPHEEANTVTI